LIMVDNEGLHCPHQFEAGLSGACQPRINLLRTSKAKLLAQGIKEIQPPFHPRSTFRQRSVRGQHEWPDSHTKSER